MFISEMTAPLAYGTTVQLIKDRVKAKIGAKIKIPMFACVGKIVSFEKSLSPSAIGCNKP